MTDPPAPARIAIAVVEQEGRYLVGRRPDHATLAGLWEFPGGKCRPGETFDDAAVRECREETGLEVEVHQRIHRQLQKYDFGEVELTFLACRLLDERRAPKEPFQWVTREGLRDLEFPEGNRAVLAELCRFL